MKQRAFFFGGWGVVDRHVLYLMLVSPSKGTTSSVMVALLERSGVVDGRHNRLVFDADLHSLSVSHCEGSGRYLSPWTGDEAMKP